jgi:hypothetical protein
VGSAEGVGLGLWIVRQLAMAHGGRAVAEARDPGVAMVITFPRPRGHRRRGPGSRGGGVPRLRPLGGCRYRSSIYFEASFDIGVIDLMTATQAPVATGSKSFIAALLLCFFLGSLGVHRFYVGKVGTGILMLITIGGFGIWTLIDFIMIAVGKFSDKQGLALAR